ncbi:MAG: Conjugal transfer protein TrbL [Gammaproteobacteria bacterium]|jgi:type IV secretion system protein VirB6|nr:Conjugal transfer protein TrbL [Gammaproteobacteria bacterium]
MSFVTNLLTTLDAQIDHYTFDGYHAIAGMFSTTLTTLLIIYFAGLGWLVIRGLVPLTPMEVAWHMLKAAFVFALALHWDYFSYFFVNFFVHGTNHLVKVVLSTTGESADKLTISEELSDIWEKGNNVFAGVWRMAGPDFLLGTLIGFLGSAVVTGIVGMALFYIIMSKVALSVLFILAPVILPMFLWGATRGIFNGWLRLLVQWMVTPVLIYAFIGLYLKLIQAQIEVMAQTPNGPTTASILSFTLLGVIVMATFKQAGNMSRDLSRKVAIGDMGVSIGGSIPSRALNALREKR